MGRAHATTVWDHLQRSVQEQLSNKDKNNWKAHPAWAALKGIPGTSSTSKAANKNAHGECVLTGAGEMEVHMEAAWEGRFAYRYWSVNTKHNDSINMFGGLGSYTLSSAGRRWCHRCKLTLARPRGKVHNMPFDRPAPATS